MFRTCGSRHHFWSPCLPMHLHTYTYKLMLYYCSNCNAFASVSLLYFIVRYWICYHNIISSSLRCCGHWPTTTLTSFAVKVTFMRNFFFPFVFVSCRSRHGTQRLSWTMSTMTTTNLQCWQQLQPPPPQTIVVSCKSWSWAWSF